MKTTRYETMFTRLREKKEGAFIPFVMLGDPDAETSLSIIDTLITAGADALELGIPFSDAVADGPVIQEAGYRALAAGATPAHCFRLLKRVRDSHPEVPMGLLIYANLVVHADLKTFYRESAGAGVDSVLVADVPVAAASLFIDAAEAADIAPVFVVPPNADDAAICEIARRGRGYTYFLGRSGVTGADREMQTPPQSRLKALRIAGAAPIVIGFGISTPEHIRAVLAAGADGAISGSAVTAIIRRYLNDKTAMLEALAAFTGKMKEATKENKLWSSF